MSQVDESSGQLKKFQKELSSGPESLVLLAVLGQSRQPLYGYQFAKRLEDGIFRWPNVQDGVIRLTAAQLSALLEGLDWKRVHAARETPPPLQAS